MANVHGKCKTRFLFTQTYETETHAQVLSRDEIVAILKRLEDGVSAGLQKIEIQPIPSK